MSRYQTSVALACRAVQIPEPVPEWKFAEPRRWRFDFAWTSHKVALEVDGGVWVQGRHSRGSGLIKEHEKMNAAATLGWRIYRCTPDDVGNLALYRQIKGALG